MLNISEDLAQKAYARMPIEEHRWAKNTVNEIDFVIKNLNLDKNMKIADFGCGIGRHVIELDKRGYDAIGIDYAANLLSRAKKYKENLFIEGDCRYHQFNEQFDAILCLYDVIGSFPDNEENKKILENISKHLKKGATALISVMNFEYTDRIAKYRFSLSTEINKLLDLRASNIMEKSGDIFDSEYFMIENGTHVIYRKEQFNTGTDLPQEYVVRDYRYTMEEIKEMCEEVGLEVKFAKYVNAKDWETELDSSTAKEILLLCEKKQ